MGTRNLTMVIMDKKPVVAQYGQWDGYPSGQGSTILKFLKNYSLDKFKLKLKNVRFTNEDDQKKMQEFMNEIGAPNGWMTSKQADMYHKKYPYMSRDHGAHILEMIQKSKGEVLLQDSSDFAGDSLFCEWAYVIDLDNNVLECYSGFNKEPLGDEQRFKDTPIDSDTGYLGVICLKKYPLNELPAIPQFIKDLEREDDEEDE